MKPTLNNVDMRLTALERRADKDTTASRMAILALEFGEIKTEVDRRTRKDYYRRENLKFIFCEVLPIVVTVSSICAALYYRGLATGLYH